LIHPTVCPLHDTPTLRTDKSDRTTVP